MRRFMLGIAFAVTSLVPAVGMADDQQIADFIKSRLQAHQQQGQLRGFNVDMTVERGVVSFRGHVTNAEQERLILQTAQQAGQLGVVQVVDDIEVAGSLPSLSRPAMESPLQTASYQQAATPPMPAQQPAMQGGNGMQAPAGVQGQQVNYRRPQEQAMDYSGSAMPMAFAETQMRAPMEAGCGPGAPMGGGAPMGYGSAGPMPSEAPNLPGYAWPGYAAHPNYGQVAYPKQYSASAWPYIGPFYPYPQVPLGWRKVSLQWDDGWWFLDFHDKCNGGCR